jgi:hypothetical protein
MENEAGTMVKKSSGKHKMRVFDLVIFMGCIISIQGLTVMLQGLRVTSIKYILTSLATCQGEMSGSLWGAFGNICFYEIA